MDNLEKVEKLREHANVTYEEAKAALEENGWDMLEAMVSLERQGKVKSPNQSQYSTSYEQQMEYAPVKKTMYDRTQKNRTAGTIREGIHKFFRICRDNSLCVNRNEELVFKLPLIAFAVILFFFWKLVVPLMIVGLFFGYRFSFEGIDNLTEANEIMNTASKAANRVKTEFGRTMNAQEGNAAQQPQQTVQQPQQAAAQQAAAQQPQQTVENTSDQQ